MYYSKLLTSVILLLTTAALHASNIDEINTLIKKNTLSIYGLNTKNTPVASRYDILGLSYNTHDINIKVEGSEDSFKTAGALQFNPLQNKMYIIVGTNYITQNYNNLYINNISQYSGTLGGGYMIENDLYFEVGDSITQLNNPSIDSKEPSKSQRFNDTYFAVAKRIESPIGTVDTSFKGAQIYETLSKKEINYISTIDYYPRDDIHFEYSYTNASNNISNYYSLNYGYFITEFMDNPSLDTCNLRVGLKASFKDITNLSSYTSSRHTKSHLTKLHKLKDVILHDKMNFHQ